MYDKVYRGDVLAHAYVCCKANRGAAGVDDQTLGDIETYGRDRWLGERAETLRVKTQRPDPVRRVWIGACILVTLPVGLIRRDDAEGAIFGGQARVRTSR